MEQVASDVQKFISSLRLINSCHPTGVVESHILSMVIAIYIVKQERILYDAKKFLNDALPNHFSF